MRRAFVISILFIQFLAFTNAEAKAPSEGYAASEETCLVASYLFHVDHPVELARPTSSYRPTNTVKDFRHLTGLAGNTTFQSNFLQEPHQLLDAGTLYPRKLFLRLLLFPDHYFW